FAAMLFAALLPVSTASAAVSQEEQVVFFTLPAAPTPSDDVALHVRRHDLLGTRALITKIWLCEALRGQCLAAPVAVAPAQVERRDYLVFKLGKLPAGEYFAAYYEVPKPTYVDEDDSALLVFEVTASGLVTVVEYFNAALGHYFITADTAEIAKL